MMSIEPTLNRHLGTLVFRHRTIVEILRHRQGLYWSYLSCDGKYLSYLPIGKSEEHDGYKSRFRVSGKMGKILRTLLDWPTGNDFMIDAFVCDLKALYSITPDNCTIVYGDKISYYYTGCSHHELSDIRSCMIDCPEYMDLYCCNANIGLGVLLVDDKLMARGLVWRTTDDRQFHDTIYGDRYSTSKLYAYFIDNDILPITGRKTVRLEHTEFDYYPYSDSFNFIYGDNTIRTYKSSGAIKDLDDTNGGWSAVGCSECGDEDLFDDGLCLECYTREHGTPCDHCEENVLEDNLHYIEHNDTHVCYYCYQHYPCVECGETYNYAYLTDGLCYSCQERPCENCGELSNSLEGGYCEECRFDLCDLCDEPTQHLMRSYHYLPRYSYLRHSVYAYACEHCIEEEHREWVERLSRGTKHASIQSAPIQNAPNRLDRAARLW